MLLENSVCTSLHLIGQIQVSKSHRDLVKKSRSLYHRDLQVYMGS